MKSAASLINEVYKADMAFRRGETLTWLDTQELDEPEQTAVPEAEESDEPDSAVDDVGEPDVPEVSEIDAPDEPESSDDQSAIELEEQPTIADSAVSDVPDQEDDSPLQETEALEQPEIPDSAITDESSEADPEIEPEVHDDLVDDEKYPVLPGSGIDDVDTPDQPVPEFDQPQQNDDDSADTTADDLPSGFMGIVDHESMTDTDAENEGVEQLYSTHEEMEDKRIEMQHRANEDLAQQLSRELQPTFDDMRSNQELVVHDYVQSQLILQGMLRGGAS